MAGFKEKPIRLKKSRAKDLDLSFPTQHTPQSERNKYTVERTKVLSVPSNSIFYPEGSEIFFYAYSYAEIKAFSNPNMPLSMAYELLLEGIDTVGMNRNEITLYDFIYIHFLRKLASFPSTKYYAVYSCKNCKKINTPTFTFDQIEINGLTREEIPAIPIEVEICGRTVSFTPIMVGQMIYLAKNDYYYAKINDEYATDEKGQKVKDPVPFMAMQMDGDFKKNMEFLNNVRDPTDIAVINEIDSLLYHYVKPLPHICTTRLDGAPCGTKNMTDLLGGESIIFPFRESENITRHRIRFGKKEVS